MKRKQFLHQFFFALNKGGPMGASTHITLLNVYKCGTIFSDSDIMEQRTN